MIAGSCHGRLDIFEDSVDLVDPASLIWSLPDEFRGVLGRKIQHYGVGVRHLDLLIDHIGDRWEVKSEGVLNRGPALNGVGGRVSLLVHDILIRMLSVLEQVADRLSETTHFPVAKLDWSVLGMCLLAASSRVNLDWFSFSLRSSNV